MQHLRLLFISGLMLILALVAGAQQSTERVIGGDDATLREFLLTYIGSHSDGTIVNIDSVPADLPFEVPFPAGTDILGSITRFQQPTVSDQRFIEVYTSTAGQPNEIADFYLNTLTAPTWVNTDNQVTVPGGFNNYSSLYSTYCYNNGEASLAVSAYGSPIENDIRLNVTVYLPGDAFQCQDMARQQFIDPVTLIPSFVPVDGVTIRTDVGGPMVYGPQMGGTSARLTTDIALNVVFEAYSNQLQAAGWQSISNEVNTQSAVSNWTFTHEGDTWNGTFSMYRTGSDATSYTAIVSVENAATN